MNFRKGTLKIDRTKAVALCVGCNSGVNITIREKDCYCMNCGDLIAKIL